MIWTLQEDLTLELVVRLEAMKSNHEDIVKATEKLTKNQKEVTSMM